MKLTKFSYSNFDWKSDLEFRVAPHLKEEVDERVDNARLKQILENAYFDENSFTDIPSGEPELTSFEIKAESIDVDHVFSKKMEAVFKRHNTPVNESILADIAELAKDYFASSFSISDPALKAIDTSTPISYWKKECPELFDYPDKMHGFKTSWELLKGVYNPNKHKTLYYNDLKVINHKLYRAIYRRNRKEKFLPTHNDRVAKEVELMRNKKIDLADIKDPKIKEKYRMRMDKNK